MSSSASARRAARNPRLALGAYPVLLPHFTVREQDLLFGDNPLRVLEPDESDFAARCDGRTPFRDIVAENPAATGRAATAPYITWLAEPLADALHHEDTAASASWLVLSPHPDDAELSLGGTLLARPEGIALRNVICFSDLIYTQFPTAFQQPVTVNAVRRDETLLAGAIMGAHVEFLGFPEFVYRELECAGGDLSEVEQATRDALKVRLYHLLRQTKPTAVFAPAAIGSHADHRMVFDCIIEFVDDDLFPDTSFHLYEDFPYCASYQAVDDFLARFEHSYLDVTAHTHDISRYLSQKNALVDIYRSQFGKPIATHVQRHGNRIAGIAAQAETPKNNIAERYWTIGVMGKGGPAF